MLVNEIFTSFQGEGPFVGTPATFLRLSGCNLNCSFCDTDFDESKVVSVELVKEVLLNHLKNNKINTLVITGGEPFIQYDELKELIEELPSYIDVHIETNGTQMVMINNASVIVSPKKSEYVDIEDIFEYYSHYDNAYFKFIISSQDDIDKVVELIDSNLYIRTVWLQPEYSNAEQNTGLILDNLKKLPNIKISGQLHKYLNQR